MNIQQKTLFSSVQQGALSHKYAELLAANSQLKIYMNLVLVAFFISAGMAA